MSHRLYHTDGFVIRTSNVGEANQLVKVFTEDFGMVSGIAQGVRKVDGKLHTQLVPYRRVDVTLVRGREWWRLIGGQWRAPYVSRPDQPEVVAIIARWFALLDRLVQGEQPAKDIFSDLVAAYQTLVESFSPESAQEERDKLAEAHYVLFAVRLLSSLGYIQPTLELTMFLAPVPYDQALVAKALEIRSGTANVTMLQAAMFEALEYSHL